MARTAVIVVNYNNVEDTRRCVASLSANEESPDLIVIDNQSQQPGVEGAVSSYSNATIIRSEKNLGFGRANNLGLREALKNPGYEFFFLLNNDATVDPDTVSVLERAMDTYPEAGIVSPRIVLMENPGLLWYGGGGINWYRGKGKVPGYLGPADSELARTARWVTFISGCALFARRAVLEKIGGFDPRFFMYEEDLELCLRAMKAGWRLRYVPEAMVQHRGQGSQRRAGTAFFPTDHPRNPGLPIVMAQMTKNRLRNMAIHAKGAHALRFWLGFPLFLIYDFIRYGLAGRHAAVLAMIKGILAYVESRHDVFENELG